MGARRMHIAHHKYEQGLKKAGRRKVRQAVRMSLLKGVEPEPKYPVEKQYLD